jgi:hypothetical protein
MKTTPYLVKMTANAITLALVAFNSYAFPIAAPGTEGNQVYAATTGHIFATYEGNSASYSNDLLLNGNVIFNNHGTPVGTTVDLGEFLAGTELIFQLYVHNTRYTYATGPASRNPDGHFHARVQDGWQPSKVLVSFEDLFNGSFDYNDLSFSFTNTVTSVPEPASYIYLGCGLVLFGIRKCGRKADKTT